LSYICR